MAYVDRNEQYVQCDMEWKSNWEPAELLQAPNPSSFS